MAMLDRDMENLAKLIVQCLDPNTQKQASVQLERLYSTPQFAQHLLHLCSVNTPFDIHIRQSASIYLKRLIICGWHSTQRPVEPGEIVNFSIADEDRRDIRANIVDVLVHCQPLVRDQLLICLKEIIRSDFPLNWPNFTDTVIAYFDSDVISVCVAAVACMYQLITLFQYSSSNARTNLDASMSLAFAKIRSKYSVWSADSSESGFRLQKLVLKTYYKYISHHLPLSEMNSECFTRWMEVLVQIVARDISSQGDGHSNTALMWSKCKKWSLRILLVTFDKYGRPVNAPARYKEFAQWYMQSFTRVTLEILLKALQTHRLGTHTLSSRCLQLILKYLNRCVSASFTWCILRAHVDFLLEHVIFPLMCISASDLQLWNDDPHEYARIKFDPVEEFLSPVTAAEVLLRTLCRQRKHVLSRVMSIIGQCLSSSAVSQDFGANSHIDGILHMAGSISEILISMNLTSEIESLIDNYAIPQFNSSIEFLKARACWLLGTFAALKFSDETKVGRYFQCVMYSFMNATDIPVVIQSALAINAFLVEQNCTHRILRADVVTIVNKLLGLISDTETHELSQVLEALVSYFSEDLAPSVCSMVRRLAAIYDHHFDSSSQKYSRVLQSAVNLMNTLTIIAEVWQYDRHVMLQLEPVYMEVVRSTVTNCMYDLYEDVFKLLSMLTLCHISETAWQWLENFGQYFEESDILDCFEDLSAFLFNCVTVGKLQLNPARLSHIIVLCSQTLNASPDVLSAVSACRCVSACLAAKVLESIVLVHAVKPEFTNKIDCALLNPGSVIGRLIDSSHVIGGSIDCGIVIGAFQSHGIVPLLLTLYRRSANAHVLRVTCLCVFLSLAFAQPDKFAATFRESISLNDFLALYFHCYSDFRCVHDRKLYIYGVCDLLRTNHKEVGARTFVMFVPVLLLILKKQHDAILTQVEKVTARVAQPAAVTSPASAQPVQQCGTLEDDEDDTGDTALLARQLDDTHNSQDDDDQGWDEWEERCELFATPFDTQVLSTNEFIVVNDLLAWLRRVSPELFAEIEASLSAEHRHGLEAIVSMIGSCSVPVHVQ